MTRTSISLPVSSPDGEAGRLEGLGLGEGCGDGISGSPRGGDGGPSSGIDGGGSWSGVDAGGVGRGFDSASFNGSGCGEGAGGKLGGCCGCTPANASTSSIQSISSSRGISTMS